MNKIPAIEILEDCHSNQVRVTWKCIEENHKFFYNYGFSLRSIKTFEDYYRVMISIQVHIMIENQKS